AHALKMEPVQLIRVLQFTDSFFPVGAFAYSDGLETAAASGNVRDAVSLGQWMEQFIECVFVPCEGLALMKCMVALRAHALETVYRLDEELTAIRPAAAVRSASTNVGKRVLAIYDLIQGSGSPSIMLPHGNAAVAYGVVFFHCGLSERDA